MISKQWMVVGALAVFYTTFQPNCQAISVGQIDGWKNQYLPAEYRNSNFTVDDLRRVFTEKCKKATGSVNNTLYAEIEESAHTLVSCLSNLLNVTSIQEEITEALPIGELDSVFHKYCLKAPAAENCLVEFNGKIQPCLSMEERSQNAVMMRIVKSLLGFMCDRGGDQLALFVAEEGPECLEANKEAISHCANTTLSEFVPPDGTMLDLFNLPDFVLQPEHCLDLERFEACTVHHLEQCREITPANVAQSVFKFIKTETNCKNWLEAKATKRPILKDPRSSGTSRTPKVGLITLTLSSYLMTLLLRWR